MRESINQLKNDILSEITMATDLDACVNKILEKIGQYFDVDRVYIFENVNQDTACVNTFEWCNEGITPEIQNLQYLDYDKDLGLDWMDNYNEEGMFFCPDVKALPPKQRNVLEPQGILSMLQCSITERGDFKGFIGFDNCQDHLSGWEYDKDAIDTLVFFSRLLSLYLLEYRNKSALLEQQENLKKALEDVQKASRAKTDFLARMSHDIRTPMNAIIGLTALALDEDNVTPQMMDYLTNIRGSGEFLLGLVNDILDMSKIEAGSVVLKKVPYFYDDFVVKLKSMFEPQCQSKNITFKFEKCDIAECVMADKLRMDQIFFNLLSNAVKFTPEGGTVTYSEQNFKRENGVVSGDYIVQDTGIGMSPEFLEHIFDPFEQEDTQYSSDLKGSGLGLAIVKTLVDLMGGTIKVESVKNKGTKITVHLDLDICPPEIAK